VGCRDKPGNDNVGFEPAPKGDVTISSTIYIVCSDRHRNGKTLLARILVDYLMLEGRDPFVIDAGFPEGQLRSSFPGRTALVDIGTVPGQMKLFDTIIGAHGRDYVIDLPSPELENFCRTQTKLGFIPEAVRVGYRCVVLFIVDKFHTSLAAADDVSLALAPAQLVHVHNAFVGRPFRIVSDQKGHEIPVMDHETVAVLDNRRFSIRAFLLGEDMGLAPETEVKLRQFLASMVSMIDAIMAETEKGH
jgi:hypothetical protein